MALSTNLGLTVDLRTDSSDSANDVPAHLAAANDNFKIIDEAIGDINSALDEINGEVV